MRLKRSCFPEPSQIYLHGQVGPRCTAELVGQLVGFTVTLGGFKVDCLKFFLKAKIISYAQRVEKISLCETDSPDTGEVALAPEGERCLEGAEGENLVIARNISGSRTVLSPTACGRSPSGPGPSAAGATSPHTVGSHPRRGGQGVSTPFSTVYILRYFFFHCLVAD